jgi:hypothetical protein
MVYKKWRNKKPIRSSVWRCYQDPGWWADLGGWDFLSCDEIFQPGSGQSSRNMMNQTTTVHFPHLWPDGKWEWAKGVIGYIRTAAAIWYEVRSPAAVTDEPIDNRQNFPTWKKILLAVIHFLFLFFFLGKREIEEEVNQARALTYSTKKENCAVVNSLWGAWFVWIAFKAGSRPLLTAAWFSTTCFFIPFQAA